MVLAIDLGGTNIRIALVNGRKVSKYQKIKTPKKKRETLRVLFELISSYGKQKVICVSTAGFERNGRLVNSLNNDMDGVRLTEVLKKKFGSRVFVENDANCAALAEWRFGAGRGKKNIVLLTLGSGIGCGVVDNGRLVVGKGGAVEAGSMVIDKEMIFEVLASGNASTRIARKEFGLKGVLSKELEEMADRGHGTARAVYSVVGTYLGIGLSNLSYLFDPEVLILGGGFTRVSYIHKPMRKSFENHYKLKPRPGIVRAKFGDNAGLIGAALLVREKK